MKKRHMLAAYDARMEQMKALADGAVAEQPRKKGRKGRRGAALGSDEEDSASEEEEEEEGESDWETEDEWGDIPWEPRMCESLFDGHDSESFEVGPDPIFLWKVQQPQF